jgi:uncharacterized protein VirK/YbjX
MMLLIFSLFRHLPALLPLLTARRGSVLHGVIKARPEILEMVYTPYLSSTWDARTRLARITDHCKTVKAIGGILDFPADTVADVVQLTSIDSQYRIALDQARWFLREGKMTMSLWGDVDRLFTLGFCLSSQDGKRVAYIGGIQGRNEDGVLDRYRLFTKQASGMRPRDFLVEVFKIFCRAIGVARIYAVSNHYSIPSNSAAASTALGDGGAIKLHYEEIWRERGGLYAGNGFYLLPLVANRRSEQDIPAKKKALYRKRYEMMDALEKELTASISKVKLLVAVTAYYLTDLIIDWFPPDQI